MIPLSIIIPCYRVEKYLRRCLDSLVSQSLEGTELVCVNDGSPDKCLSILKEYRERYGDRIVVIDKENEGVWKARMDGIAAASGEYIGFIDPDDYVKPDYAMKLYNTALTYDADIAVCGFDRVSDGSAHTYSREMTGFKYDCFDIRKDPGLLTEVNAAPWNKIFKASLAKGFRSLEKIPPALDDMMFSELLYKDAGVMAFVRESLIIYTVREDSIINSINPSLVPSIYASMAELRRVFVLERPEMLTYVDASAFLHLGISLMYRLCPMGHRDGVCGPWSHGDGVCGPWSHRNVSFARILEKNTAFLDRYFPLWRKNPYISLPFVIRHRGSNLKLLIVRTVYGLGMFPLFLKVYTGMIKYLKIDVKW